VDHRADLPAPAPWRSAAFIAASVATVELLVLLVVGIWLFGKFFSDEVSKATGPTTVAQVAVERKMKASGQLPDTEATQPAVKPVLGRRDVSVLVLNGTGVGGAAATLADRLRGDHYLIAATGNASRTDFARSVVMFRPKYEREARRLSRDIGVRHVTPLDGLRLRDLQGAHVAVVIGG
jgi:hypothetical protein